MLSEKQPAPTPTPSRAQPAFDPDDDEDVFFPPNFATSTPTPIEQATDPYFDPSIIHDGIEVSAAHAFNPEPPRVYTAPAIPRGPTDKLVPVNNLSS